MLPLSPRKRAALAMGGMVLLLSLSLQAGPILHERFEPDPSEDLRLGATTGGGTIRAALDTPSGLVGAPSSLDGGAAGSAATTYGGARATAQSDARFYLDRLTTAPAEVSYDEPFRPSVLPFKRLYVFDQIAADLSLSVQEPSLKRVSLKSAPREGEDAFFGDFYVDLVPGSAVRIPSPGPSASVRALYTDPPVSVELMKDGAENWFAKSNTAVRTRMILELGLPRIHLAPRLERMRAADLDAPRVRLPGALLPHFERVRAHIGLSEALSPAQLISALIDYFRGFEASDLTPRAEDPASLYEELALARRGVCRHRAYAFFITAVGLGVRVRLVHNEAHAWVEVFDGAFFHRVDLGGAAMDLRLTRPESSRVPYRPPSDPFPWPQGSESGAALSERETAQDRIRWPSASDSASPSSADGTVTSLPGSALSDAPLEPSDPSGPEVVLLGQSQGERTVRGGSVSLSGYAARPGEKCALARVDFFLKGETVSRPLGSLSTDREGRFQGQVTLPGDIPVGEAKILALVGAGCQK